MNVREISKLLNDGEINKISDLFLSACGFNTAAPDYRLVRNAVIILPHCTDGEVYYMLSAVVELDTEIICARVEKAVEAVGNLREKYNATFVDAPNTFDHDRESIEMPATETATEALAFLGSVLSYIIRTNYHLH